MANYVLDKAYRVSDTDGIEAGRAVVRGSASDECGLPSVANQGNVLGITTHNQPRQGRYIGVRRMGIATTVAAGAIECGEPVCIADDQGRVGPIGYPRFNLGSVGDNNALTIEWRDLNSFSFNTSIVLSDPGSANAFSWSIQGSAIQFSLANDGAAATTTAAELKAAIEADPVLNKILKVSHTDTSNGAELVVEETVNATTSADWLNPIGIAEQSATQAGDLIDIKLTI